MIKLTSVVNLRKHSYDVYIGRAGQGQDGYFGNPYRRGEVCSRCGKLHQDPSSTLPCFKAYFYERLNADAQFRERVHALEGARLGCFCKPAICHGDIIADYLNSRYGSELDLP